MLFNELLGDPEAESGAGGAFGGKEGIEDLLALLRMDAVAVVRDIQPHTVSPPVRAGRRLAQMNADDAAAGHGIQTVGEQVGEDLHDLVG